MSHRASMVHERRPVERRSATAGPRRSWLWTWLAALAIGALIPSLAAAEQGPQAHAAARKVIETLYTSLLDVMQNAEKLGYRGRYDKLEPVLRRSYDFDLMAKVSLGGDEGYWGKLDDKQKKTMIDAFSRMSISTYANRFDGYSGQKLEVQDVVEAPKSTLLVKTRIVRTTKDPVALNYLLRDTGKDWRIIDVFAKGTISELAKNRSDYTSVMRLQGFEALIAALNAKVAKNAQ